MSGFELCRQWHADEMLRSVPFILHTTGDGNPEDERFGMALGARRFVRKSIGASAFADIINQTLAEKDLQSAEVSRRTLLGILEDQKRTADALRVSEQRMRAIIDSALDGIITINHEGRIVEINPAAERMFELVPGSVLDLLLADCVIPPRLREKHTLGLARYLQNGSESSLLGRRVEMTGWRADGTEFPVELTITHIPTDGPPMFTGHIRDITEQMVASQKLMESEERHRRLVENSPLCIHEIERDGTLSSMNPAGLTMMELAQESQIRGAEYLSAVSVPDRPRIRELLEQACNGQTSEFEFESPGGQVFQSCFVPVTDGDGRIQRIMGITQDVTEKLRAEQALRESEAKFREVAESLPVSIAVGQDGRRVFTNQWAEVITGYTRDELLRKRTGSLAHPDFHERLSQALAMCVGNSTPSRTELKILRKDGQERWVYLSLAPIQYSGRPAVLAASIDITEHKLAELRLQESEARYRVMTENATEAIVILDVDTGRFVDFNQNACELYKASREQLLQMGPADVSPELQPDGTPSATLAMERIKQVIEGDGQVHVFEWTHQDLEDGLIPCEVRLVKMPDQNKRLVRGAITDISDRKHAEAERESFIQQLEQKNAELERFTYTVSHDLKSPLITIKGFLGLLERDLKDDRAESVQDDIAEIASAADRMNRLLDDLLELSRIGRIANPVEGVALQELAQQAIELIDAEIVTSGTGIHFDSDLPVVTGDRARLLEVFQNLLHNAVRFSVDQPHPEVHLGTRQENGETVIYIRDNGIGIQPQYHDRVFSLFEQLTPDGNGTGIGLSIVKRVVHVHGGWIRIESDGDGHGSTFCFTLGGDADAQ